MKGIRLQILVNNLKKRKKLILIFSIFGFIYASISIVNHYMFRTYALDLGMFNHAIYNFSHLQPAIFTLGIDGNEMSYLATHFSLITILYSPLSYIFGSYTLLFIQITSILFGGLFVYKYSLKYFDQKSNLPYLIVIHFFSIWGIYSALSFDYHNNVLGAMLIPAFIYFVEKRNIKLSFLLLILVLFTKEIMSIWLIFILLGLILKNRKCFAKTYYKLEISMIIFCLIYGVTIIFFVMPSLQGGSDNLQFTRYSYLGNSFFEIILNIIKNPELFFNLLFTNTLNESVYDYIKIETYLMFILAGGLFCIVKPQYIIMLIPVFSQKFLSNDYAFWGINGQYSIEFVPIISLATINFLRNYKKYQTIIIFTTLLLTIGSNIKTIESRKSKWYNSTNTKFYGPSHYKTELNIKEVQKALKLIEKNSSVSASSSIVPHISLRDKIYHFPIIKEANYIALFKNRDFWPLTEESFKDRLKKMKKDEKYLIIYESENLIIMKKNTF